MKTVTLLCISISLLCGVQAQIQVPRAVSMAFQNKFPAIQSNEWEEEEKGVYEAEFKMKGRKMSAAFDETGKWLETETAIKKNALPDAVKKTIAAEFPGYEIDEAEKLETPEGLAYEVELEKEENKKEMEIEVLFSQEGALLKKVAVVDKDDDD